MPKKHKYFPPSLYKVSGAWVTISGLVLAAWAIPYFNQSLHFNFPACLKIIIVLFAINLIYLFHLEFNNSQITDDQLEELTNQYKSLKDNHDKLSKDYDSLKKKNEQLELENHSLNDRLTQQRSTASVVTQNIEQLNVSIVAQNDSKFNKKIARATKSSIKITKQKNQSHID